MSNEHEPEVEPENTPETSVPYVRQRPAHRSVEPIDDFANESEGPESFAHDSDFTTRGGVLSVDPGQTEGAKAIGMTHIQTMTNVILPQALRNIMPQIGNNLIINIKDTCVLSVIGIVELFYTTKGIAGALYTYFEAFAIAMVIYFILTFACSRLLRLWENRMDGPDNFDLATTDTLAHTSGMYSYNDKAAKKAKVGDLNSDSREGR